VAVDTRAGEWGGGIGSAVYALTSYRDHLLKDDPRGIQLCAMPPDRAWHDHSPEDLHELVVRVHEVVFSQVGSLPVTHRYRYPG